MPRKSARLCKDQTAPFHMMTRRRASQTPVTTSASPGLSEAPTAVSSPGPSIPEDNAAPNLSASSSLSSLSSIPTEADPRQPSSSLRKRKASAMLSLEDDDAELAITQFPATEASDRLTAAVSPSGSSSAPVQQFEPLKEGKFNSKQTHTDWKENRYWPDFNTKRKSITVQMLRLDISPEVNDRASVIALRLDLQEDRVEGAERVEVVAALETATAEEDLEVEAVLEKDDSPEPPRKPILTAAEEDEVKLLKARQQELKRVFNSIGAQQVEILENLATRDINKICRKPKAHKNIPEYESIVTDLEGAQEEIGALIKTRYDYYIQQEHDRYEKEKELVDIQFKRRCEQVKEEHLEGLNGDITLLKKAHARDEDSDRTETGSERDFMPFHHEFPESNTRARGYASGAVQDEKSFKEYIESTDDHVRQELIEEEIRPLLELIHKAKKKRQEHIDKEKTQNMEALAQEADHRLQLDQIGGYLIPRPLAGHENAAYGLSALADVADYVAQLHHQKNYIYMPLSPGHQFPRNALNFDPLPGQRPLAPAPAAATQPPPATSFVPFPPTSSLVPPPVQSLALPPPAPQQTSQPSTPHSRQSSKPLQPPFQGSPIYEARPAPPGQFGPPPPYHVQHAGPLQQPPAPPPRPSLNLQTNVNGAAPPSHSRQSSLSTPLTPHVVSTGPGQPIAPAPPKSVPNSVPPSPFRRPSDPPPYRQTQPPLTPVRPVPPPPPPAMQPLPPPPTPHTSLPPSPYFQPPPHQPLIQQQFIFQPPQQPAQHHPAPPPVSMGTAWVPRYSVPASPNSNNPNISSITTVGAGMGHTGKIPVTFVNQTVQSRRNAAGVSRRRGGGATGTSARDKGSAGGSGNASRSGSEKGVGSEGTGSRPGSAVGEKEKGIGVDGRKRKERESGGVRQLLPKA